MTFDDVKEALLDAIDTDAAPGLGAAVAKGDFQWNAFVGLLVDEAPDEKETGLGHDRREVDEKSIYDLASLTKILSTAPLVALAIHRGLLSLDEELVPRWPGVTVEYILRHRGGLPAWMPFYESINQGGKAGTQDGRRILLSQITQSAPEHPLDQQTLYSDLGFIKLAAVVEERLGAPLKKLFRDLADDLYDGAKLHFLPLKEGLPSNLHNIAPTEHCPWRKRMVHGQVHDDNAFAMGGVAGHAGLFGSVADTLKAGQALLEVQNGTSKWEAAEVLQSFMEVPADDDVRPLGFDRATPGGSTGDVFSANAVGHLGFTGTSLWLDDNAVYVLLTNRVCPSRSREGVKELRQAFHTKAFAALQNV
ncbi:MAG: serine hydrolase [Deltaproteobacteria bacterium]|nr:serine hydrolase [Deltaproteobacteria bacterium]